MGVYAEPSTATWVCKPLSTHDTLACCWYSLNMNIEIKLVAAGGIRTHVHGL